MKLTVSQARRRIGSKAPKRAKGTAHRNPSARHGVTKNENDASGHSFEA